MVASRSRPRQILQWMALACLILLFLTPSILAESILQQAAQALAGGKLEEAERFFRQAAETSPEASLPRLGLAETLERKGDLQEALRQIRQAAKLGPNEPTVALVEGRVLARLGATEASLTAFGRARELGSRDPQAYLIAALLLRDTERATQAIDLLRQADTNGLQDASIAQQLGLLLLSQEDAEAAWEVLGTSLETHPENAGLVLAAGLTLAKIQGQEAEAEIYLRRALEQGGVAQGRLHLELGSLLLTRGETAEATEHLRRAVELLPELPEAHYRLGNALRSVGDTAGARASLERFRELSGHDDRAEAQAKELGARLNRIQSLASTGRLEEALVDIEAVLDTHPTAEQALALQAKVFYSMNRPAAALQSLLKARKENPSKVEYCYLEGVFWARLEQPAKAEEAMKRALALDPGLAEAEAFLGALVSDQGRHGEAAKHFEMALSLGADSVALRLGYARTLEQLGRRDESQAQVDLARRLEEP